MLKINEHYLELEKSYLFSDIARKVSEFVSDHPDKKVIRMGIGDVTLPLAEACVTAIQTAAAEMGKAETFRGYGPEQGYEFLREVIAEREYQDRGINIGPDDIFISDGAKSDTGNILDIFGDDLIVAVADPVYPVYVDTNIMAGRKTSIIKMPCLPENNFLPVPPAQPVDLIYLCSPNNPTGAVIDHASLKKWVDYALSNKAVILFDAAYEAFTADDLPKSIYEIDGAERCAIEFRSFSKKAGFTGVRCGFTVVPSALVVTADDGCEVLLKDLWNRRQTTKFNGVSYVVQRAAEAVYTKEGEAQCKANIDYYLRNARLLKESLESCGYQVSGGANAPYVWMKIPEGYTSWSYFDYLLETIHVVTTPGSGFGDCGEGFIRFSAFSSHENCVEAMERFRALHES
ncbi:MAG: LL-diaminopimelate aminotransferase [Fastidiosipilaceae bacterium]